MTAGDATTLPERFQISASHHAGKPAMRHREDGRWATTTYRALAERVRSVSTGLVELGVGPGDRVGLLSTNRPAWAIADLAVLHAGAVTVPVYDTLTPEQTAFILQDAGVRVLVVEGQALLDRVRAVDGALQALDHVVTIDPVDDPPDHAVTLDALEERGARLDAKDASAFQARWQAVAPGDLATLIYTSGTTGEPKGVALTHRNITSNIQAGLEVIELEQDEQYLSFLPLSHSFERVVGHFAAYWVGATVWFAESVDTLARDLRACRPTLMLGVPRVYEKMRQAIREGIQAAAWHRRKLAGWALSQGARILEHREAGREPSALELVRYGLAERLVLSRIRAKAGLDRVRFAGSGAAALDPGVARFFGSLGMLILEGYGLTEASPVITLNRPDDFRIGSVGKPLPGVEVRIDTEAWDGPEEQGELLARGPNIMQGYWGRPEETAATVTEDGWLRTGDIAERDTHGYLHIRDRKKELFKTAYGKYVAPAHVEALLQDDPLVDMAMAVGAERKYVAALVVPDFVRLEDALRERGLDHLDREAALAHPLVRSWFEEAVDRANRELARHEQVKRFALVPRALEVGQELTPTLKVKRRVVHERYADLIDTLY